MHVIFVQTKTRYSISSFVDPSYPPPFNTRTNIIEDALSRRLKFADSPMGCLRVS